MRLFAFCLLAVGVAAIAQTQQQRTPPAPAQMVQGPLPDKVKLFIPYKEYSQEDNKKILAMFEDLRVSDVSDGMDVVGLKDVGIMDPEIKTLWRDTKDFKHRVIGIAVTARYVPTNKREYQMSNKAIGDWYTNVTPETFQQVLFPGSVLVIDATDDGESRTIGSNNIMGWKKRGMVGVITSGGLADSDEIIPKRCRLTTDGSLAVFVPGATNSNR